MSANKTGYLRDDVISDLVDALKGMLEVHGVWQSQADSGIVNQSLVELSEMARAALEKAAGVAP